MRAEVVNWMRGGKDHPMKIPKLTLMFPVTYLEEKQRKVHSEMEQVR